MTNDSVSARRVKSPRPSPHPHPEKMKGAAATFSIVDNFYAVLITGIDLHPINRSRPPPSVRFCSGCKVYISELILMSLSRKNVKFELWPIGMYKSPNL